MAYLDTINRVWDTVRTSMGNIMNDTAVDLWFGGLSVTSFDGNTIVFDTDEEMKSISSTKNTVPRLNAVLRRISDFL